MDFDKSVKCKTKEYKLHRKIHSAPSTFAALEIHRKNNQTNLRSQNAQGFGQTQQKSFI